MSRCFVSCALVLVAGVVGACSSTTSQGSMSPQDQSVWMSAREKHGVGALDDKTFQVMTMETGKSGGGDADTLEFAGGRFHSTACDPYGFGTGEYTTKKVDGGIEFRATCRSESGGVNEWHGTVRGDAIEGGFVCTAPGSPTMKQSFSGMMVK